MNLTGLGGRGEQWRHKKQQPYRRRHTASPTNFLLVASHPFASRPSLLSSPSFLSRDSGKVKLFTDPSPRAMLSPSQGPLGAPIVVGGKKKKRSKGKKSRAKNKIKGEKENIMVNKGTFLSPNTLRMVKDIREGTRGGGEKGENKALAPEVCANAMVFM